MQSKATSVKDYLDSLPADRREALEALRRVIRANLDKDFEEGMQYGMIGYYVPHRVFPAGYHCDPKQPLPFAALASQKNHMSLYLGCLYTAEDDQERAWFEQAWTNSGRKLDMGKSCVRFKRIDDVPLEVVGEAIRRMPAKRFIEAYKAARAATASAPARPKRAASAKSAKKATAKKTATTAKKRATKPKPVSRAKRAP